MVSSLLADYSDWPALAQVFKLERQSTAPHAELGMLLAIDQATDHANDEINRLLIVKSLPANE